jgi:hypothetical protein
MNFFHIFCPLSESNATNYFALIRLTANWEGVENVWYFMYKV